MSYKPSAASSVDKLDVQTLLQEIRELRQRIDDGALSPPLHNNGMPEVVIQKDPANISEKLKPTSFPIYNGDKPTYPAWRRAVLSALKLDWNTFHYTNSRVFLMIYKALEGKAQRQAAAYFESGGKSGKESPEDFIKFLDQGNWDPTKVARARGELNRMKMGNNQSWDSFFPSWANKLTESHGDNWPDETKITILRGALKQRLRTALAGNHLIPLDNYSEWTSIVGQISMQFDEITREQVLNQNSSFCSIKTRNVTSNSNDRRVQMNEKREWGSSGTSRGYVGDVDSVGDSYMGGVNMANVLRNSEGKALRAKWKTQEEIARLQSEGRCYRCEQKGCNTRICRLLPAQKSKRKVPIVSNVTLAQLDPSIYEIEEQDIIEENQKSEN